MKRFSVSTILLLAAALLTTANLKGEGIQFKGFAQTWLSYGELNSGDDSGYGFTLRRVRLKPYGAFSDKIKWTLQVGWDKQSAKLIDVYIDFLLSKEFNIRIGQFTAPGTISGTLTSSSQLDFLERPMVTEKWSDNNALSSFRAIGIQADGEFLNKKLYYAVMLSNSRTAELFNPSIKSTGYTHTGNGLMFWGRLEARPTKGLTLGAFYGGGKETDTDIERNTYGAHIYYVDKGFTFKIEYLAGKYGIENAETEYNGFYALLGYKTGKIEPILRFDSYTPIDGAFDSAGVEKYNNFTLGVNYYYNKNVKFQANYLLRDESTAAGFEKIKNNLFYVCIQYSY